MELTKVANDLSIVHNTVQNWQLAVHGVGGTARRTGNLSMA